MQKLNINKGKAAQEWDIPSKIVKENSDIFSDFLLSSFNDAFKNSYLATALKQGNITPVFKAFDYILNNLYLAKLRACGFSFSALKLIHSYLTNGEQSFWKEVYFKIPKRSILRRFFFNIFTLRSFLYIERSRLRTLWWW